MEINQDNKLYKLFMWCLGICEAATWKSWLRSTYKEQTNLCHFIRVICIYTPLIIISTVLLYAAVGTVVILPFILFSLADIGFFLVVLMLAIVGVGIAIGVIYLFAEDVIWDWFRDNEVIHVTSEYIKAKKEKICPYIYFKRSE